MEDFTLKEIAQAAGLEHGGCGMGSVRVSGISTDTRTLSPGDLFVALEGPVHDGRAFIAEAVRKGAAAVLAESFRPGAGRKGGDPPSARPEGSSEGESVRGTEVPFLTVADARRALVDIAGAYRRKFSLSVVGITGSNGKTTTKDLLGRALSAWGETVFSERSFNNFIGVPLTLFRIDSTTRYAVLEIGTNAPHEVRVLTRTARPEVGVVTNISHAHLKGLRSLAGVAKEKADLLLNLEPGGTAVLNRDDPFFPTLEAAARGAGAGLEVVTFGFHDQADFRPADIEIMPRAEPNGAAGRQAFTVGGARIVLSMVGRHSIMNALAAIACAAVLGEDINLAAEALRGFTGTPMRLKPFRSGSLWILDDTWNANPASVAAALDAFAEWPAAGRRLVVLGDMLELGKDSGRLHRRAGRGLARPQFAVVAAVGGKAEDYAAGAVRAGMLPGRIVTYATTGEAIERFPALLAEGDSILVKGSRGMRLERLVKTIAAAGDAGDAGKEGSLDTGNMP